MKMKILFTMMLLILSGCATYQPVGEGKEVWLVSKTGHFETPLFCYAMDPDQNGFRKPICLESENRYRATRERDDTLNRK